MLLGSRFKGENLEDANSDLNDKFLQDAFQVHLKLTAIIETREKKDGIDQEVRTDFQGCSTEDEFSHYFALVLLLVYLI